MSGFATVLFPNSPTDTSNNVNQFGDSFNTAVHTVQIGVIVGATIGSVVFVGSIVAAFLIWRHKTGGIRRRRRRNGYTEKEGFAGQSGGNLISNYNTNDENVETTQNSSLHPTPFMLNPPMVPGQTYTQQNSHSPSANLHDPTTTITPNSTHDPVADRRAQKAALHIPQPQSQPPRDNTGVAGPSSRQDYAYAQHPSGPSFPVPEQDTRAKDSDAGQVDNQSTVPPPSYASVP
ncbi:hypothetical protein CPC08DRAFT_729015 [Agrocybe pediades]|nr:hypothetical protein CPC08DRAFT_729015 [Agrocybe pediades]